MVWEDTVPKLLLGKKKKVRKKKTDKTNRIEVVITDMERMNWINAVHWSEEKTLEQFAREKHGIERRYWVLTETEQLFNMRATRLIFERIKNG